MRRVVKFLRDLGIKVWVDNEKLVPGTPIWEVEIEKAIREAKEVVILQCCNQEYQDQLKAELTITVSDTENNLYDSR